VAKKYQNDEYVVVSFLDDSHQGDSRDERELFPVAGNRSDRLFLFPFQVPGQYELGVLPKDSKTPLCYID